MNFSSPIHNNFGDKITYDIMALYKFAYYMIKFYVVLCHLSLS